MTGHAGYHAGRLLLCENVARLHRAVAVGAGDIRVHVFGVTEEDEVAEFVDADPVYGGLVPHVLIAERASRDVRDAGAFLARGGGVAVGAFGSGGGVHFVAEGYRLRRDGRRGVLDRESVA